MLANEHFRVSSIHIPVVHVNWDPPHGAEGKKKKTIINSVYCGFESSQPDDEVYIGVKDFAIKDGI